MDNYQAFDDKNILLVCAESFSWPMHYVAERLRNDCASLSAIFIQPGEAYFEGDDYKAFKSLNNDILIHEMSSVVSQYLNLHKQAEENIDWKYINKIESLYTKYSSINEQLIAEMTLLPCYHDRGYYEYIDYNRILLYVQIYYQYMERLIEDNGFDIILDCGDDFFGRGVLLEIASKNKVPYISIDQARFNSYVLPSTSLKRVREPQIEEAFNNFSKDKGISFDENILAAYQKIMKSMESIQSEYKESYSESRFNAFKLIKRSLIRTLFFYKYFSFKKFKLNVFDGVSSPICSNVLGSYKFTYLGYFRRFYLEYGNVFEKADLTKINYIFIPLQVIPESSTSVLSPYYINEYFIIESLSKSIRPDQFVVVKEHWNMIGYRNVSFYKQIKRLPNVILIDPTIYPSPTDYIRNSDLVVTTSGSSGLEASFMGVNSLIMSDVIYGLLSCNKKISITPDLRKVVAKHIKYKMPVQELYAYIKLLLEYGAICNIDNLQNQPSINKKINVDEDVTSLLTVFANGLELYNNKQNKDL
jgi:hypothetical protein